MELSECYGLVRSIAFKLCHKFQDVEDVTQETMLKAYRSIGTLKHKGAMINWIKRIAINVCLNKRKEYRPTVLEDDVPMKPETKLEFDECENIHRALLQMKPKDRNILMLFYFKSNSVKDLARILKVPVGTIKRRLHIARSRLKCLLKSNA